MAKTNQSMPPPQSPAAAQSSSNFGTEKKFVSGNKGHAVGAPSGHDQEEKMIPPKTFFHSRAPGPQLPPELLLNPPTPPPPNYPPHPFGYGPDNYLMQPPPPPFPYPNFEPPSSQFGGTIPPWEESPFQKTPSSVLVAGLPTPSIQWQRELEEVDRYAEVLEIDGSSLHTSPWSNAKKEEVERLLAVNRGVKPTRTSKRRGQITHLAFESEQRELLDQERRQATRVGRQNNNNLTKNLFED